MPATDFAGLLSGLVLHWNIGKNEKPLCCEECHLVVAQKEAKKLVTSCGLLEFIWTHLKCNAYGKAIGNIPVPHTRLHSWVMKSDCDEIDAGIKISVDRIRYELNRVQRSVMYDLEYRKRFVVPWKLNPIQKSIFGALEVNHQEKPDFLLRIELTSL